MDQTRILIIGAYGQLGKALMAQYPKATGVDRDSFDMTDWAMLQKFDWSKYDTVINAAAYTRVDDAESPENGRICWQINAVGPGYLARLATEHGLTLVHVSSDYVFDGTMNPHREDETFNPLNVYGQSKAAGDNAVAVAPKHYIMRTTWLIGDGPNFIRTMLDLAAKGTNPTVVNDQIGRLTFVHTLVEAIDRVLTAKAAYGTYNVTNDGEPASWADMAKAIFAELPEPRPTVKPVAAAEYYANKPGTAPRPQLSIMDLSKLKATGLKLADWRDDLRAYIRGKAAS